jgi:lysophospholipid acyltransferase (LPLAT)-like uncharacterized protein
VKHFYYWLRQRLLPRLVAKTLTLLLFLLGKTLRYKMEGEDFFLKSAAREGCILLFWHNRITLLPEIFTLAPDPISFAALISNSRDGEIIASICESYCKKSAIRVPHQAKFAALKKGVDIVEKEKKILAITPDGPRGPRYKIKPGVALAASSARCPVFAVSWCSTRFWQLSSWDKLIIPKPFSTVYVSFSKAHFSQKEENLIDKLEQTMKELDRSVEEKAHAIVR